jgi:hypothetical protein
MSCNCEAWIQNQPVPGKVLIFKCSVCRTSYTLYPNGEIAFETERGDSLANEAIVQGMEEK